MTAEERTLLQDSVKHIFDSGANEIRIIELVERFIKRDRQSYAESIAKERAVEFHLRMIAAVPNPKHEEFVTGNYDNYAAEQRKEGEPKFIHEEIKNSKVVIQRKEGAE